jgi:hypothetical protein
MIAFLYVGVTVALTHMDSPSDAMSAASLSKQTLADRKSDNVQKTQLH